MRYLPCGKKHDMKVLYIYGGIFEYFCERFSINKNVAIVSVFEVSNQINTNVLRIC